jgi:hypothetical protein
MQVKKEYKISKQIRVGTHLSIPIGILISHSSHRLKIVVCGYVLVINLDEDGTIVCAVALDLGARIGPAKNGDETVFVDVEDEASATGFYGYTIARGLCIDGLLGSDLWDEVSGGLMVCEGLPWT